ncbi:esterase-like activity of phytase family protein [Terrimonas sp. NA20]|uniref:Esterase-like activity of phytase family protein n=1 Tax=Terrimonas ginsenosidimutans TaxID=2908004 RepID=A0ABS9KWI1_9BACT|nr:esterase-like activity of phytase family protein [Terrimonas ginsenosidimutans]MCG2616665.1 esterase-like activity of phytase family protein [Terrimonas ginsenosidimutans]
MRYNGFLIVMICLGFVSGCKPGARIIKDPDVTKLRFVNQFILPNALVFDHTTVGGLSGIDYDPKRDLYYMVCDDPSALNPTRFYTMRIPLSEKGIDSVIVTNVTTILDPNGQAYPDIRKDRIHSADLEAMRYDASRDELVRSSEGQRQITPDTMLLQDPDIVIMDRNGRYKDSFFLPAKLRIRAEEKGPRHNSVLEGLAFDENYKHLFVSLEDALYDDGPKAGNGDSTAFVRIFKFDRNTRQEIAEYVYQVDPVPYPSTPPGAFKINGISDILYAGGNKLIVIERAWSTGRVFCNIRVYLADLTNAQDVSSVEKISTAVNPKIISKKLLVNMDDLGIPIYNVEGVTVGPKLPNGNSTLIFVVDDNFNKNERSQFLLFEIIQ